jgi:hypothetical protein
MSKDPTSQLVDGPKGDLSSDPESQLEDDGVDTIFFRQMSTAEEIETIFFRQMSTALREDASVTGDSYGSIDPNPDSLSLYDNDPVGEIQHGVGFFISITEPGHGFGQVKCTLGGYRSRSSELAPMSAPESNRPDPPIATSG